MTKTFLLLVDNPSEVANLPEAQPQPDLAPEADVNNDVTPGPSSTVTVRIPSVEGTEPQSTPDPDVSVATVPEEINVPVDTSTKAAGNCIN